MTQRNMSEDLPGATTGPEEPDSENGTVDDTPLVRCTGVTHEYQRGSRRGRWLPWRRSATLPTVQALVDVSCQIHRGEVVGIAGSSGSGKSTLLHLIAGLASPTAGQIQLVGTELTDASERERVRLRRQHIGFVFQRFHLLGSLSARANVALPLLQLGMPRATRRERATAVLEQVGLGDRVRHSPAALSGGEQQRVAIARALVTDPDVILADEPTGELDTATSEHVLDLMTDVAADRGVMIASHDDTALAVTDRLLNLRDGKLITNAPG